MSRSHVGPRTACPSSRHTDMGDAAEDEQTFESTDAGASETYPMEAGQIRKGGHIMIKGNPCKVLDVSTSKTGKHGHAKCHFVAQDIFTGKKMEDLVPASHTTNAPFVKKMEYQCIDINDEFLTLLTDSGDTRDDIKLPKFLNQAPPDAGEVSDRIEAMLGEEKGALRRFFLVARAKPPALFSWGPRRLARPCPPKPVRHLCCRRAPAASPVGLSVPRASPRPPNPSYRLLSSTCLSGSLWQWFLIHPLGRAQSSTPSCCARAARRSSLTRRSLSAARRESRRPASLRFPPFSLTPHPPDLHPPSLTR